MTDTPDWATIEIAFRLSGASTRRLARRYGVSEATLRHRARRGGWKRGQPVVTAASVFGQASAEGLNPLQYLYALMVDETVPLDRRADAAIKLLPYFHRRLGQR